jgi:hypothetical protein
VVRELLLQPATLARLSAGAREHASRFGWGATVDGLLRVYTGAMDTMAAAVDA